MKKFIEGIKEGQKYFGENIAIIINSALLSLAYVIGVGIVSITAKIFKKEFLDTKISNTESYWSELNLTKKNTEEYYRQF